VGPIVKKNKKTLVFKKTIFQNFGSEKKPEKNGFCRKKLVIKNIFFDRLFLY